jgi:peptide deformylase
MVELPNLREMRIICYPEPRLRQVAAPIAKVESFHRDLARRMAELMIEAAGVGLAANQVGWTERLVVISVTGKAEDAHAFINPRIISRRGSATESEGCLSVPGVRSKVRRAEHVQVVASRLDGQTVEVEADGTHARVWQHEIDHLDGMLFVDKVGMASKVVIAYRLHRLEKAYEEATSA